MNDLPNDAKSVNTIESTDFDMVTVIDLNDAISIAQLGDDGELHDVIISHDQAEQLMRVLAGILG